MFYIDIKNVSRNQDISIIAYYRGQLRDGLSNADLRVVVHVCPDYCVHDWTAL